MKSKYLDRLSKAMVLFDGAMGTALYEKGVFLNRCFEEVNVSMPETVIDIHIENINAGAQVLTTNSFGANPLKLAGYNIAERTAELNITAVELAREAIKRTEADDVLIAGSVGPLGKLIEPVGKLTEAEARAAFAPQIRALAEAGVDLILLETFRSVPELLLAASVARKEAAGIPVQAHFSMGPLADQTSGGALEDYRDRYLKEAVERAVSLDLCDDIDVIGTNCGVGPADMLELLLAVRTHVKKPFVVMPNAGFPKDVDGRQIYLADPDYFSEYALKFLDAGAAAIGGCCGTTPEHISKMGKAVLNLATGRKAVVFSKIDKEVKLHEQTPLAERSGLGKALAEGRWITTIELIPPMGTDLSKIIEKAGKLVLPEITTVNLPDGPRASSRISTIITALEIMRATGIEPIVHYCCRDKNLIAMQADLLGCEAVGLRNMMMITGDPPKVGNYPDVTGVFDVDAIGLLELGRRLNTGIDLGGNAIGDPTSFVMGAGVNPAAVTLDVEIERAYRKAEAGADFFITQPVFDIEALINFINAVKDTKVPVIIGVWPLASYRNALFLNNEVPGITIPERIMKRMERHETKEEARLEGISIAREIVDELRPVAAGVQVSPPFGNVRTAIDVITSQEG
ncbi:MAG: bifunctional homocysteine S-methyltransferase/methylenetetrahydrofolate reductase [Spirochaetales bacterium]|nr:bifunctional homocysteine S-methyltransferase/methylenetetrahydrofolate reductase [Spirochaetales bacterium]